MRPARGFERLGRVTDRAPAAVDATADTAAHTAAEAPAADLPLWWWARGLNLRERLDAPWPPAARRVAAGVGRLGLWSIGDRAGFAARLAALSLSDDLASALGEELPTRLGSRTDKPSWAQCIEQAVAKAALESRTNATPDAASAGLADARGAAVFLPVLRPLIALAWAKVAAQLTLPQSEHAAVRRAFEERLGEQLSRQSARALVTELSRARAAGQLPGASSQGRFAAFIAQLSTRQGLSELFTRYPVLARMLGQTALDAADAMLELAARLSADRERIAAELFDGVDPGALVRMDLGRGDAHQGNRSVAMLHFANGSVVYKPRPLDQHALLDEAVGWLNAKVPGLGLRTPRAVRCKSGRADGYGWLEFIEHRWCESVTEADRFFRRQGALLALLYAVDGTDVHYENLIACGDQPVLVDAETLLHSGLPAAATAGADPAARALDASVHRTGLLPHLLIGDNGALDLSALGRTEGGVYPSDVLRWENPGTDEMRVVRGAVASPTAQNQPLPGPNGHADHRAALLEGFRAGYDAIARHRAELLDDDGFLTRWAQSPARLIARATRFYGTLLEESTHPDLLRDALARDAVFALLWTESQDDPARQRLIEEEIADLWRGDVPVFFHRPSGTAVWSARGTRLDGVLPAASVESVLDKIAAMSEVDRYDQEWVIAATLAVSGANTASAGPRSQLARRPASAVVPTPSRLLAAACGIADEIGGRAVRADGRANWLGMERVAGMHWAVLPMGGGLAEGYCGVALFLAQLGELVGAERYTELPQEAVRPLPLLLSYLAGDPELSAAVGPGALSGLGGIIYALVRLSKLLGESVGDALPDAITALAHATDALMDHPDAALADLSDGLAGAMVAAALVHETSGADDAGKLARRLADRLLAFTEVDGSPRSSGFAHGDAGIGWALLRYAHQPSFTDEARPHAAAGTALLRAALETAMRTGDLSWHSGLAGTVLAAVDTLGPAAEWTEEGDLDYCVRLLASPAPIHDLSLYQGVLGMLEPLLALAERGHGAVHEALVRRAGGLLGLIEQQGHQCATPENVPSPGLLNGLSGIGYGLLRLAFPQAVPSVVLLEP